MRIRTFVMHSLRRGMILSVAVPLLISVVVCGFVAVGSAKTYSQAKQLSERITLVRAMGALIHEQQKERGTTSVFLSSNGEKFASELAEQRDLTNAASAQFVALFDQVDLDPASPIGADIAAVRSRLDEREELRNRIDGLSIPTPEALGTYTSHNGQMLAAISRIGAASFDRIIAEQVASLEALLTAKEFSGIERAIGSGGFAVGAFDLNRVRLMERLITRQSIGLIAFERAAEDVFREGVIRIANLDATQELLRMRDIAFASFASGDLQGVTASDFFAASTVRINAFKEIEDQLVTSIEQRSLQGAQDARNRILVLSGAIALTFAFAYWTTRFVLRNMLKEIRRISDAGDRLAKGDETVELPTDSPKELGRIVYSVNFFRESVAEAKKREAETVLAREATEKAARDEEEQRQREEKERVLREAEAAREEQDRVRGYVSEMSAMVNACARGDFTQTLQLDTQDGVWAEVADGLNRICTGVRTSLDEIGRALGHMAQSDLTYEMKTQFEGVFAEIADAVREASGNISRTLSRVAENTNNVSNSSKRIAGTTSELSRRSEENANMLMQTATSIDEMSELVRSATESSQFVRRNTVEISKKAAAESESAKQTIDAMQEIKSSSEGIVKILSVIDDIAFQTNLLALNAGVEAARAGEAGRGFAVVATEVRALAQRSSDAAKEIAQLVETSAESIRRGVGMVDQTANALNSVVADIQDISDQIRQITESFENTKSNIDRVAKATSSLDQSTRENVSKIEAAHQSVESLETDAQTLMTEVETFAIKTEGVPRAEKRKVA